MRWAQLPTKNVSDKVLGANCTSSATSRTQLVTAAMKNRSGVRCARAVSGLYVTEKIRSVNFLGAGETSRSGDFINPKYMKTQCCVVLKITLTDRLRKELITRQIRCL